MRICLATKLEIYRGSEAIVVLAIVRGGVLAVLEVAKHLGAPLDVILIRRLLLPRGPGEPTCAVNVAGTLVLDEELLACSAAANSALDSFIADALDDLARCEKLCRNERPAIDLAGKTVLLVDNGIRTGATMRAAICALHTRGPARIVAATPVAATESRAEIEAVADDLVCLAWPQPFGHVGLWYSNFTVPGVDQIRQLLE